MLHFRDFVPAVLKNAGGGIFIKTDAIECEDFASAVRAAGVWINMSKIQMIQLETVVLPSIWSNREKGSTDTAIGVLGTPPVFWHQFIRVWYVTPEPEPGPLEP